MAKNMLDWAAAWKVSALVTEFASTNVGVKPDVEQRSLLNVYKNNSNSISNDCLMIKLYVRYISCFQNCLD